MTINLLKLTTTLELLIVILERTTKAIENYKKALELNKDYASALTIL